MLAKTGSMPLEYSFDSAGPGEAARHAQLAEAAAGLRVGRVERAGAPKGIPIPPGDAVGGGPVPLLGPLSALLPEGLRRGDVVVIATGHGQTTTLTLALLAGALRAGLWGAAIGVAGLGGVALSELLGDQAQEGLNRLLVVPDPAGAWPRIIEVLADGVDLLLLHPPGPVPAGLRRRIEARLRQGRSESITHRPVLLVLGEWPGAQVTFRTVETVWTGLSGVGPTAGTGHLTGCMATVTALGRATAGRSRVLRLWLPGADGAAHPLTDRPSRAAGDGRAVGGHGRADVVMRRTEEPVCTRLRTAIVDLEYRQRQVRRRTRCASGAFHPVPRTGCETLASAR
jgi:hypothetical protein